MDWYAENVMEEVIFQAAENATLHRRTFALRDPGDQSHRHLLGRTHVDHTRTVL